MIYHAALPVDWETAQRTGVYTVSTRGRTLDEEGFIHASYEWQVEGVVNRFYADVDQLVLLVIDRDGLDAPVIDESPTGDPTDERFPHVYGPLPVGAIREVRLWKRRSGRPWALPYRNPDQTGRV